MKQNDTHTGLFELQFKCIHFIGHLQFSIANPQEVNIKCECIPLKGFFPIENSYTQRIFNVSIDIPLNVNSN